MLENLLVPNGHQSKETLNMPAKIKTEVEFEEKNGRTYSRRTDFYENGQICKTGTYTCSQNTWAWDVPAGAVKSFFENGQLESEVLYNEFGVQDGESTYFDKKGSLLARVLFRDGVKIDEKVLAQEAEQALENVEAKKPD